MSISTRKALRAKQVESEDPLVVRLAETGAEDPEYLDMVKAKTANSKRSKTINLVCQLQH